MPLSDGQRARVLDSIASGRLPLDPPRKMYAGYGDGRACSGCGGPIERTHVEYESIYENGRAYHLHLACAGVWDVQRQRRHPPPTGDTVPREATREQARALREEARTISKDSAQLRDRAELLAREAEAVIEESRWVKRGESP